jgi:hypothetical protein
VFYYVLIEADSKEETETLNTQIRDRRMWLVRAKENITMGPRCRQIQMAKLEFQDLEPQSLVCMKPAQIPIQGIFPARSLTRVGSNIYESLHVTRRADRAEIQCSNASAYVLLANFSEETLTIPKATNLGIAEVSEQLIDKINSKVNPIPRRLLGCLDRRKTMFCTTSSFRAS